MFLVVLGHPRPDPACPDQGRSAAHAGEGRLRPAPPPRRWLKEGSAYNEGRVQRDINEAEQKKQREKEEAANDPNRVKPVKPTEEQLRNRLKLRREHLKSRRDDTQTRCWTP
ncbi:hypothetical protein QJS66_06895 [Kocuria rhizophila]|nr:hypothetical protein QJS66_06895 [Kocuria rhizophila]